MPRFRIIIVILLLLLSALFFGWSRQKAQERQVLDALIAPTGEEIALLVADSPQERELGLGGRIELGQREGMLFVFDEPGRYGFWMKGMLFPLDIVWLDTDLMVVHVEENIATSSYPRLYEPPVEASYVLELTAGTARQAGIAPGEALRPKEKLPR